MEVRLMLSMLARGDRLLLVVVLGLFAVVVGTFATQPVHAADDTLVVAIAGEPGAFDPCFGAHWTIDLMYALYETPVGFVTTESGDYEVQIVDDAVGRKPVDRKSSRL